MNLEEYRIGFATGIMVLMLIAAVPSISLYVSFPSGERFSELWLLDKDRGTEDYPFDVHEDEPYSIFVGVGNHMGESSYYLIYIKLRNQTQPPPNVVASQPSLLTPVSEFRAFVPHNGTWEAPITFRILDADVDGDSAFLSRLSINEVASPVNASALWNPKYKGFYFQLFLELWRYNTMSQSFQYHGRFVGIWLNMTSS